MEEQRHDTVGEAPSAWRRAWRALDERLGLSALQYPVPPYANTLSYSLGGITLICFLILVATGFLLIQFYDPSPLAANQSTRYIMTTVPLGRYLRGLHYWTAQVMLLTLVLHLLRLFVTAAYKRPREANWLLGLCLFVLVAGLYFTGTVLKWDQEGYEAMVHNMEGAALLGTLGVWFSAGFTRSVPMLVRLFVAHVSILPALLTVAVIGHLALVKYHEISPSPWAPAQPAPPQSFARHLGRLTGYGLTLLGALLALAVVFPPGVGPTPVQGVEVTRPALPLVWLYPLENWLGLPALLYVPPVLLLLLALVPFLDRSPERRPGKRKAMMVSAGVLLALLLALMILGRYGPSGHHLG